MFSSRWLRFTLIPILIVILFLMVDMSPSVQGVNISAQNNFNSEYGNNAGNISYLPGWSSVSAMTAGNGDVFLAGTDTSGSVLFGYYNITTQSFTNETSLIPSEASGIQSLSFGDNMVMLTGSTQGNQEGFAALFIPPNVSNTPLINDITNQITSAFGSQGSIHASGWNGQAFLIGGWSYTTSPLGLYYPANSTFRQLVTGISPFATSTITWNGNSFLLGGAMPGYEGLEPGTPPFMGCLTGQNGFENLNPIIPSWIGIINYEQYDNGDYLLSGVYSQNESQFIALMSPQDTFTNIASLFPGLNVHGITTNGTDFILYGTGSNSSGELVAFNPQSMTVQSYDSLLVPGSLTVSGGINYGGQIILTGTASSGEFLELIKGGTQPVLRSNQTQNYIYSSGRVIGSISGLDGPIGLAYDSMNNNVYAINFLNGNVSVIGGSDTIAWNVTGAQPTYEIQYDPVNSYLYLDTGAGITYINTKTNATGYLYINTTAFNNYSLYSPLAIALNLTGNMLYVTVSGGISNWGNVSVFNLNTSTLVRNIPVGSDPTGLAYDNANGLLYVSNFLSSNVSVVNPTNGKILKGLTTGSVSWLTYDPNNNLIYGETDSSIIIINGSTNTLETPIQLNTTMRDDFPNSAAFDPVNNYLYVPGYAMISDQPMNGVILVNTSSNKITGNLTVGKGPDGSVYDPSNGYVYVSNFQSDNISVINTGIKSTNSENTPGNVSYGNFTFSINTVLTSDVYANNVTIEPGVTVKTEGYNFLLTGTFDNRGTLETGYTELYENLPYSYGGSGGGGGFSYDANNYNGASGQAGFSTLSSGGQPGGISYSQLYGAGGITPSLQGITSATISQWFNSSALAGFSEGMSKYLAGATGGYSGNLQTTGASIPGSGAWGVYIQAKRIIAGTIDASGQGTVGGGAGSGGGGGGTILLAYGSGGIVPGQYSIMGGSGKASGVSYASNYGGNGGNGQIYSFNYSSSSPVISSIHNANYTVTLKQSGLPSGTEWSVTYNGITYSSTGNIVFSLQNGTYFFTVNPPSGYHATYSKFSVTVLGSPVYETIQFKSIQSVSTTYSVVFEETGLPYGTQWSVDLSGDTIQSTNQKISYNGLYGGSYSWYADVVSPPPGTQYNPVNGQGTFSIVNSGKVITVAFNTYYDLQVSSASPSYGQVNPSGATYYKAGTVVDLSAAPQNGYAFNHWTSSSSSLSVMSANSGNTSVYIGSPGSVTAVFTKIQTSSDVPDLQATLNTENIAINAGGKGTVLLELKNTGGGIVSWDLPPGNGMSYQTNSVSGSSLSGNLASGSNAEFTITFTAPTVPGNYLDVVNIKSNGGNYHIPVTVSSINILPQTSGTGNQINIGFSLSKAKENTYYLIVTMKTQDPGYIMFSQNQIEKFVQTVLNSLANSGFSMSSSGGLMVAITPTDIINSQALDMLDTLISTPDLALTLGEFALQGHALAGFGLDELKILKDYELPNPPEIVANLGNWLTSTISKTAEKSIIENNIKMFMDNSLNAVRFYPNYIIGSGQQLTLALKGLVYNGDSGFSSVKLTVGGYDAFTTQSSLGLARYQNFNGQAGIPVTPGQFIGKFNLQKSWLASLFGGAYTATTTLNDPFTPLIETTGLNVTIINTTFLPSNYTLLENLSLDSNASSTNLSIFVPEFLDVTNSSAFSLKLNGVYNPFNLTYIKGSGYLINFSLDTNGTLALSLPPMPPSITASSNGGMLYITGSGYFDSGAVSIQYLDKSNNWKTLGQVIPGAYGQFSSEYSVEGMNLSTLVVRAFSPNISSETSTQPEYSFSINETGLPANTTWSVRVDNQTVTTNGTEITLFLPYGTYAIQFNSTNGYVSNNTTVNITAGNETGLVMNFNKKNLSGNELPFYDKMVVLILILAVTGVLGYAAFAVKRRRR